MATQPPIGQGGPEAITLVVTQVIKPAKEEAFLETARAFADLVYANEPGVLLYVLTKHPTQPHTYVWVERYANEAVAAQHRDSSYMAEVRPKLAEYLDGRPEVLRLTQIVPA